MLIPGRDEPKLPQVSVPAHALSFSRPQRMLSLEAEPAQALPLFAREVQSAIKLDPHKMLRAGADPIGINYRQKRDIAGNVLAEDETTKRERIHNTAQQFEGMVLGTMLKQVWQSLGDDPLFGKDQASTMYREMWVDEVSKSIASGPQSLGIARLAENDMLRSEGLPLKPAEPESADAATENEETEVRRTAPQDARARIDRRRHEAEQREVSDSSVAETRYAPQDAVSLSVLGLYSGPAVNIAESLPLPGSLKGGSSAVLPVLN